MKKLTFETDESSNIAKVDYDFKECNLDITFKNGGVYRYLGVPFDTVSTLISAKSIGKEFCMLIKNKYTGVKK